MRPIILLAGRAVHAKTLSASDLEDTPNGRVAHYAGIATLRQQSETAGWTIFISLEDENGDVQVVVWKLLREKPRLDVLSARLLAVYGTWQREGDVKSLIAGCLFDMTPPLGKLATASRDFH